MTKILYTAHGWATHGGRTGEGRTDDGKVAVKLSVPKAMGGDDGPGVAARAIQKHRPMVRACPGAAGSS